MSCMKSRLVPVDSGIVTFVCVAEQKLTQLIREARSKENYKLFFFCCDNYHIEATIITEASFTLKSLERMIYSL